MVAATAAGSAEFGDTPSSRMHPKMHP